MLIGADDPSMSELDYVVRNFDSHFAQWRNKRIVLHGSREYARAIMDAFDDSYRFIAVATSDCGFPAFAGKEVWSTERLLAERPDLVILTERVRHAEAIYQEIGPACRMAGIPLFDMYGLDWLEMRDEIDGQGARTLEQWLDIIAPYDIVSFETPDCLMMPNPQREGTALVCRPGMLAFAKHIVSSGKKLLFIGRRPYTAEEQVESLAASGLVGRDEDVRDFFFMREGEDGAWRTIRATYPDARILHVGFGIPKECVLPRYYGIDTCRKTDDIVYDSGQLHYDALALEALDSERLRERLEAGIEQADIVSFDVFDTLLMRTTLVPEDVFDLVEKRALENGLPARGFSSARLAAQHGPNGGTAEHISRAVQQALGCSDADCEELYRIELAIERESTLPREPMCALLRRALACGKKVLLVSDMYHSSEAIDELLQANGISGYHELFVSSDQGILKRQGLLERAIPPGVPANRIIHIGDSINNDICPAKAIGMQTVLVPSPLDLALAHGLNRTMHENLSLEERCELGRRVALEFADPFEKKGMAIVEGGCETIPYPAVATFCAWMSSEAFLEKARVHVAPCDCRVPVESRRALLAWYPFPEGTRALFLGSDCEAFAPLLRARYETLDLELAPATRYDFIVALDILDEGPALRALVGQLSRSLAPDGVLLMGFRNRFGIKYLCGAIDAIVSQPFETLDSENRHGVYGKAEMRRILNNAGLKDVRTYYAMPDSSFVQAIYTDDYIPCAGIHDRVMPFDAYDSPLVATEHDLYPAIVEEGMLPFVANYHLFECRMPNATQPAKRVVHATLSLDRGPEHSFITTLFTDGTALKAAAFPEGRAALEALYANDRVLRNRSIATIDSSLEEDGLHMPLVEDQHLLAFLASLPPGDPGSFIATFEQLYDNVLRSSGHTAIDDAEARRIWRVGATELGPILETGYIDMIPYNAFWNNGELRFFDQEFTIEKCPAKYVLFRALRYTWIHLPHVEQTVSLESMKKHFGLERLWSCFTAFDESFLAGNRNWQEYVKRYGTTSTNRTAMDKRRQKRLEEKPRTSEPYEIGLLMGVFDLFHVGHLRLIERAKQRCRFLRVAVLADDLVYQFKRITPTIPLEQRMEIIAAIDGVDEVVAIEDTPSRLVEWERRPFDCFFSGDDYAGNEYWEQERRELEKLGATIEFFSYTEEQSSTSIRKKLAKRKGASTS